MRALLSGYRSLDIKADCESVLTKEALKVARKAAKPKDAVPFQNFLTNEHDRYGRSVPLSFRIQPTLEHDLNSLLLSGRLPFQSKEEAARWAFNVGVRSLANLRQFDYSYSLFQFPIRLYEPINRVEPGDFMKRVEKVVHDLSALGYRTPELHRFLTAIEDLVACLPSCYDRDIYLTEMEKYWSRILESTRWPDIPSIEGYHGD